MYKGFLDLGSALISLSGVNGHQVSPSQAKPLMIKKVFTLQDPDGLRDRWTLARDHGSLPTDMRHRRQPRGPGQLLGLSRLSETGT